MKIQSHTVPRIDRSLVIFMMIIGFVLIWIFLLFIYINFECDVRLQPLLMNHLVLDGIYTCHAYFLLVLIIYPVIFCQRVFNVSTLEKNAHDDFRKLASAIYLQVSTISQALIFVTRSRSWSYVERPGLLLVGAFLVAQLVSPFCLFISL